MALDLMLRMRKIPCLLVQSQKVQFSEVFVKKTKCLNILTYTKVSGDKNGCDNNKNSRKYKGRT